MNLFGSSGICGETILTLKNIVWEITAECPGEKDGGHLKALLKLKLSFSWSYGKTF